MAKAFVLVKIVFILSFVVLPNFSFFHFKRYSFRRKGGNERRYRSQEENCKQNERCQSLHGLDREKCVKICISESCYEELYSWNELEEGEIDVRLTSFKGCVVKQIKENEMRQRRKEQL
ncbi:uncharacterized protein LOC124435609 [Xenia sp. Carnegie-2017]|uniref:uncharacterized protein LOC124435609 n=1 Tax=Xenia sp. Carnegie-2017 TaxID=2897299 RepID=UPI001F03F5C3|nr:uncharacterized protein LOC124435609 [Xenia sp. Carnegie-2017]